MQKKDSKSKDMSFLKSIKKDYFILSICTIMILIAFLIDIFTEINYFFTIMLMFTCLWAGVLLEKKRSVMFSVLIIISLYVVFFLAFPIVHHLDYYVFSLLLDEAFYLGFYVFYFYPITIVGFPVILGIIIQVVIDYIKTPKEEFEKEYERIIICYFCNSANTAGITHCKKCGRLLSKETNYQ